MQIPFDSSRLDALMDRDGLDVLIATSKHNVQYLTGGHRFHFFDYMDAIGLSRYLPAVVYLRGRPQDTAYFGNAMETPTEPWPPISHTGYWGTRDTCASIVTHLQNLGVPQKHIGAELGFLPADAYLALTSAFPDATLSDCVVPLERLRAIKTEDEIRKLRFASEGAVASMMAVMQTHGPGTPKRALAEALRREETSRGLQFEYCLCTLGQSFDRAPSDQVWQEGEIISLDSGCNFHGYIGDLCRMGILGEPDAELEDLLAEIESVQQAARKVVAPGKTGSEVMHAGLSALAAAPNREVTSFVAHGMGLVSHEAPRMTGNGPVPYPGADADEPLQPGMVTSVETTMLHPERGFIKLEDTVLVTPDGNEGLGDTARGWTRAGTVEGQGA
ncbi:M24 family metallopeptidase [Halovulum sp. GXIMD14794]